jgi:hypothetical protein
MIFFVLILSLAAMADDFYYDHHLSVCPNKRIDNQTTETIMLTGWSGAIPSIELPTESVTIDSNWSYLSCRADPDGSVVITTSIPADAYPLTEIPQIATCSTSDSMGHTHHLNLRPHLLNEYDLVCWPMDEAWYSQPTVLYAGPNIAGVRSMPLVSTRTYDSGMYSAELSNGNTWNGVTCTVSAEGGSMSVSYTEDALGSTGVCPLPSNGTVYGIPLTIDRVE